MPLVIVKNRLHTAGDLPDRALGGRACRAVASPPMGMFKRKAKTPDDDELVNPENRSPVTGLKYKDLQLLGAIKDSGAKLDAPRHVLHYLYFPSEAAAQKASEACQGQGWEAAVREPLPDFPGQWSVLAEQASAVLTLEFVRGNTDFFEEVAALYDGEHDGWEVGPDLPKK